MRMQLQMTAPLDIGMEFADDALKGDVFDLTQADGKAVANESDSDSESESALDEVHGDKDEDLGSEDGEHKVSGLENDLDGMYERYRERLAERDLKFKAKEARRKDQSREEWGGIKKDDEDEDGSSESEEGGWDVAQAAKNRVEDDSSSDSDSDEGGEAPAAKKRRTEVGAKLITKLEGPKQQGAASKAAQVWFSQDLFKGVADEDIQSEGESEVSEEDASEGSNDEREAQVTPSDEVSWVMLGQRRLSTTTGRR